MISVLLVLFGFVISIGVWVGVICVIRLWMWVMVVFLLSRMLFIIGGVVVLLSFVWCSVSLCLMVVSRCLLCYGLIMKLVVLLCIVCIVIVILLCLVMMIMMVW